jgi:ribosome-interacting GTPase 1
MKRLGISVEGATEREFVHQVLRPHLEKYQISVTAIDIEGNVSLDKIRRALPP